MIVAYDSEEKCWVAAGKGYLRPIVIEAGTRKSAVRRYGEVYLHQQGEEYAMEQSMTALALEQPYGVRH